MLSSIDHAIITWTSEITRKKITVTNREYELYFQQILITATNKALFHRRLGSWVVAHEMFDSIKVIYSNAKCSHNPDTQFACARYILTRAVIYADIGSFDRAIEKLIEGLKCLLAEQEIRNKIDLGRKEKKMSKKNLYKCQRNVRFKFYFFIGEMCNTGNLLSRALLFNVWTY